MQDEPHIVINGITLPPGAAMTVRVAIETFMMTLNGPDALGKDAAALCEAYKEQIRGIRHAMYRRVEGC